MMVVAEQTRQDVRMEDLVDLSLLPFVVTGALEDALLYGLGKRRTW